jgi:glycosyltransferase involved in cell wall biosynthesis
MSVLDIVMTTFNEDKTLLKRSLDSIMQQTYTDFQLILVLEPNDTNTCFIDEYALNNKQIVVIKNKQKLGFVASLNKGVKSSTAKYIARLDTDDVCHPERLSKQVQYLEENHDVDVLGAWVTYDDTSPVVRQYPEHHNNIKDSFLLSNAIAHPVVVLKRELFKKFGYYDELFVYSEDLELWLRLLAKGCRFHNLQESLLTYSIGRRNEKPKLDRVFIFQARLRHNKDIYHYVPAMLSILIYKVLSFTPNNLFTLIKRILSKRIGNLYKERR